jgi:hypothetical protein
MNNIYNDQKTDYTTVNHNNPTEYTPVDYNFDYIPTGYITHEPECIGNCSTVNRFNQHKSDEFSPTAAFIQLLIFILICRIIR